MCFGLNGSVKKTCNFDLIWSVLVQPVNNLGTLARATQKGDQVAVGERPKRGIRGSKESAAIGLAVGSFRSG